MNKRYKYLMRDIKKRYLALYGIFGKNEDGIIFGYTEKSFSMGWSNIYVRLWTLKDANIILDGLIKNKIKNRKDRYFIYRLTRKSPNALIVADFKRRNDLLDQGYDKYEMRNIVFKINKMQRDS